MSSQDIVFTPQQSLIGRMQSYGANASNAVDGSGIIWNESADMFKTTTQQFLQEPLTKVNFSDFVPEIEEKRNKKNESCLNFAHRIDLKILRSIEQSPSLQSKIEKNVFKRKKTTNQLAKDQVYTMNQLQSDVSATASDRRMSQQPPLAVSHEKLVKISMLNDPSQIMSPDEFLSSPQTVAQTPNRQDNKQFKYSATKISYEKLVQQAKSKLIRTFLEREKRRQDQYLQQQLSSPKNNGFNKEVKDLRFSNKKISNVFVINQERFAQQLKTKPISI